MSWRVTSSRGNSRSSRSPAGRTPRKGPHRNARLPMVGGVSMAISSSTVCSASPRRRVGNGSARTEILGPRKDGRGTGTGAWGGSGAVPDRAGTGRGIAGVHFAVFSQRRGAYGARGAGKRGSSTPCAIPWSARCRSIFTTGSRARNGVRSRRRCSARQASTYSGAATTRDSSRIWHAFRASGSSSARKKTS